MTQLPRGSGRGANQAARFPKIESTYFSFGHYEWSLWLYPFGDGIQQDGRVLVTLTRQTSMSHVCRVRYRITLGEGESMFESGIVEQMLDLSGAGTPVDLGCNNIFALSSNKTRLMVKVDLIFVAAISEVQLNPFDRSKNRCHIYDRDKQTWVVEVSFLTFLA